MRQDLLRYGLQLEDFGGEVQAVEISAMKVNEAGWTVVIMDITFSLCIYNEEIGEI